MTVKYVEVKYIVKSVLLLNFRLTVSFHLNNFCSAIITVSVPETPCRTQLFIATATDTCSERGRERAIHTKTSVSQSHDYQPGTGSFCYQSLFFNLLFTGSFIFLGMLVFSVVL